MINPTMQVYVGLLLALQQLDFSAADCNGLYFKFEGEDHINRPVYPFDICGEISIDGSLTSYQYTCKETDGMKYGVREYYNDTECEGIAMYSEMVNESWSDWPVNATQVEVRCDEDDCDYTILKISDCNDTWNEEMFIVNECIEYDDEDKSEEWSCSEDGVTITYYDGDDCFGSGSVNGTADMLDLYFGDLIGNDTSCMDVTSCANWTMDCATENSAKCAYCAQYAPCINSIDPHCTNHEALGCLECKHYAECAVCAPGWDNGCIAMEWHSNHSCANPEIVVDNETISIPARMDGECHYNSIWESYMKVDCKTGSFELDCTNDCSNCSESTTFSPWQAFDVQITDPMNAECFNYSETETCDSESCEEGTNITEYLSMNVYGHCTHDAMTCPDGNSCGPEACSTNTSSWYYDDYCIEIEIFDENSTCSAETGAGNYTAFAIADNTCRLDGSGRSYYALECAEGVFYGVIGCLDCLCSENCTDIVAANTNATGLDGYIPNTCYQYELSDNLQMAGIINETLLECSQNRTQMKIQPTCDLTHGPSVQPTVEPTYEPSLIPTNEPTEPSAAPTCVPTDQPSYVPTTEPSDGPTTGSPTMAPTFIPTQDPINSTTPTEMAETTSADSDTTSGEWMIATDDMNMTSTMEEGLDVTTAEPEADRANNYRMWMVGLFQMMILSLITT